MARSPAPLLLLLLLLAALALLAPGPALAADPAVAFDDLLRAVRAQDGAGIDRALFDLGAAGEAAAPALAAAMDARGDGEEAAARRLTAVLAATELGLFAPPALRERAIRLAREAPDWEARNAAVAFLGRGQVAEGLKAVVAALKDPVHFVRLGAVRALGDLGARATVAEVAPFVLADGEAVVRLIFVRTVERLECREALPALVRVLDDADPEVAKEARYAISSLARPEDGAALAAGIAGASDAAARVLVEVLGALPDVDMEAPLLALLDGDREGLKPEARRALYELWRGGRGSAAARRRVLADDLGAAAEPGRRVAALALVAEARLSAELEEPAMACLDAPERDVREAAVDALAASPTPRAARALLEAASARSGELRARVVERLRGAPFAVFRPILESGPQDPGGPWTRATLYELLATFDPGPPEVAAALGRGLADPFGPARAAACAAVARLEVEGARESLKGRLRDPYFRVRAAAALGLARLAERAPAGERRERALELLVLLDEREPPALDALVEALSRFPADAFAPGLARAFFDAAARVRANACLVAGRLRVLAAAPAVRGRLEDADPAVRREAALALPDLGEPAGFPEIVKLLDDEAVATRPVRRRALETLRRRTTLVFYYAVAGTRASNEPAMRRLREWWERYGKTGRLEFEEGSGLFIER